MTVISYEEFPTLAAIAICKNEENDLPGFINHLLPWVDEVVIVDDCSTDGTRDILENASGRVKFILTKMDSVEGFAGLRNIGIEATTADWLLHMDVDERVPAALAVEIREAIRCSGYSAFKYRRINFFLHRPMRGCGLQDWNKPQLAKREHHFFRNRVHEECVIQPEGVKIGQLEEPMWHLNDESYLERIEKSVTYCQNQCQRLKDKGIKIRFYHLFLLPLAEFLRKYFYRHGYLDGVPGLIFAIHSSTAMFKACALLWDMQNRRQRSGLEYAVIQSYKDNYPV